MTNGCDEMGKAKRIPRAEFERLWMVEEWGGQRVADHFGVNRSTVTTWARAFGLPLRLETRVARMVVPADRVPEMVDMWRRRVKVAEIARHFGCGTRTVYNTMRRHGEGNRGKGSGTLFLTLDAYLQQELARRLAREAMSVRGAWAAAEMVDSPQAFQRLTRRAA